MSESPTPPPATAPAPTTPAPAPTTPAPAPTTPAPTPPAPPPIPINATTTGPTETPPPTTPPPTTVPLPQVGNTTQPEPAPQEGYEPEQSRAETRKFVDRLHNQTGSSLWAQLSPYMRHEFCGRKIRDPNAPATIFKYLDFLPGYVVPMFATFNATSGVDFEEALGAAVDFVKASQPDPNADRYIVIPINSPGGEVDVLLHLLAVIRLIKTNHNIQIVTYACDIVASCAFVLCMQGDVVLAAANSKLMCHDPMMCMPGQAPIRPAGANRLKLSLDEIKEKIYDHSELHILLRTQINKQQLAAGAQAVQTGTERRETGDQVMQRIGLGKRQELRQEWYDKYEADVKALFVKVSGATASLPQYEPTTNIFRYLMEDVCKNPHDQFLTGAWYNRVGAVDSADIDLWTQTHTSLTLNTHTEFDAFTRVTQPLV